MLVGAIGVEASFLPEIANQSLPSELPLKRLRLWLLIPANKIKQYACLKVILGYESCLAINLRCCVVRAYETAAVIVLPNRSNRSTFGSCGISLVFDCVGG